MYNVKKFSNPSQKVDKSKSKSWKIPDIKQENFFYSKINYVEQHFLFTLTVLLHFGWWSPSCFLWIFAYQLPTVDLSSTVLIGNLLSAFEEEQCDHTSQTRTIFNRVFKQNFLSYKNFEIWNWYCQIVSIWSQSIRKKINVRNKLWKKFDHTLNQKNVSLCLSV